jgi:hypothetical protein
MPDINVPLVIQSQVFIQILASILLIVVYYVMIMHAAIQNLLMFYLMHGIKINNKFVQNQTK